MDINNRDEAFAKKEKELKHLKEGYAGIFKKYAGKSIMNEEDAFSVGKKLKAGNKPDAHTSAHPLKEEDAPEDTKPVDDKPTDDAPVGDSKPAGDAVPPKGPVGQPGDAPTDAPAPISTATPEGGDLNSQDQLTTRGFVDTFLKTLPSDVDLAQSVDANGIFKASVNDAQNGQFVVVVYPATKNAHQVADLIEPALPGSPAAGDGVPPAGADAPVDPTGVPPVPPVPGAVPGADGSAVPPAPVAPAAGDVPPVPPAGDAVPPKPEGEEEPMAEAEECKNPGCTDPHCPQHGADAQELKESEREKQRDPILTGRKNWNSMVAKLLLEGKKAMEEKKVIKEEAPVVDVSKLEARVKSIEKSLAAETDAEEKEKLKVDLGKAKMALSRAKDTSNKVKPGTDLGGKDD
jgi:hypothetical protein